MSSIPVTRARLVKDLRGLGVRPGMTLLVHSSMKKIGHVCGGAVTVIEALLEVLGPDGTLMMPTHTGENSDPARWRHPPVPPEIHEEIRRSMPAFDPARTPSSRMGAIPELFRTWPGVSRSGHPVGSFAALGPRAEELLAPHGLSDMFGEGSPVARLYDLGGWVLLLGVGHDRNTSLHLSEHRADWDGAERITEGSAVMVDGERRWVNYEMPAYDHDDFVALGEAFEEGGSLACGCVGAAPCRLMSQRELVDFGVSWISAKRPQGQTRSVGAPSDRGDVGL